MSEKPAVQPPGSPVKPLKVAQLLFSGLGGHGSVVFSLINSSQHDRHWQSSLAFLGVERLAPDYAERCQAAGTPYLYFQGIPKRPWKSWSALCGWLAETEPDIIIMHPLQWLLPCWWYARRRRVPLIVVEHHPNSLKEKYVWVFSALSTWLADQVVLLTPIYREELRQKLGVLFRANKARIIPNGIDVIRFAPTGRRRLDPQGPLRIGMAARFAEGRRQDLLVDMLALLKSQRPAIDWRLTLAGDGATREPVRERVVAKRLQEAVDFPGHLSEDEMIAWFQSLDVYAHASEGETLSTSLLQAMAMTLPIVASDISGIRAILHQVQQPHGVLVEQTPQAFATSVEQLRSAPEAASEMGMRARRKVVEAYSQDAMFAGYAELVAELVARR